MALARMRKIFGSLIDSMLNKADDGITKNFSDGLTLAPSGSDSDRVISFKQNIQDNKPLWSIDLLNKKENKGLGFVSANNAQEDHFSLFLQQGGHVGIGTTNPQVDLDVAGTMGNHMRIGTYVLGIGTCRRALARYQVSGTTKRLSRFRNHGASWLRRHWKARFTTRACTYFLRKIEASNTSHSAHYGWWWNKISIRWTGSTKDYGLKIKTRTKYPPGVKIKYHIAKLWDNQMMSLFED